MQEDFHYYATYCAAYLAGYSHDESLKIGYAAQFVDCCSRTLLQKVGGPKSAATTQLQPELAQAGTDLIGLQDITRIWASFHFLPYDLYADIPKRPRRYMNLYRLICDTNSDLLVDTVNLARKRGPEACGVAMHVLADTWAHRYFAGTPSFVINDASGFYELLEGEDGKETEREIIFKHNPIKEDDLDKGVFINCVHQGEEHSIMNLGHGRAGHLPDYSFIRYRFTPAWGNYRVLVKDNPSDYYHAFCQMVYALKLLRGCYGSGGFEKDRYEEEDLGEVKYVVMALLRKRQLNACNDWKHVGEKLSGCPVEYFDIGKYQEEYMSAAEDEKDNTFLGRFFIAALAQKSMVTNKIFKSGSLLAGLSVDYDISGFKGIKDFMKLAKLRDELRNMG